jgi:hypothetical protein
MTSYKTIEITRTGAVATIRFTPPMLAHDTHDRPPRPGRHREIGMAINELRFDNTVRVIVITGKDDIFCMTAPSHPRLHGHAPGDGLLRRLRRLHP